MRFLGVAQDQVFLKKEFFSFQEYNFWQRTNKQIGKKNIYIYSAEGIILFNKINKL